MNKLQKEDLKILKTLDAFCKEHDISYVLYAGTLLGAIRHQGYIPWDDDVDVAMDRKNFDRFEKLMSTSSLLDEGYQREYIPHNNREFDKSQKTMPYLFQNCAVTL